MLINFKLKNFKSYNNEQTFTMLSGKSKLKDTHLINTCDDAIKLVPLQVIYGGNAGGKSNLLEAFIFLRKLLANSSCSEYSNSTFRFDKNMKNETTTIVVQLLIDKRFYEYGFELFLKNMTISKEWLKDITTKKSVNIFTRDMDLVNIDKKFDNQTMKDINVYKKEVEYRTKTLFLTILNEKKNIFYVNKEFNKLNEETNFIKKIYDYLEYGVVAVSTNNYLSGYRLFSSKVFTKKIEKLFQYCDVFLEEIKWTKVKIDEIQVEPIIFEKVFNDMKNKFEKNPNSNFILQTSEQIYSFSMNNNVLEVSQMVFLWKGNVFAPSEMSKGTKKLLQLLMLIFSSKNKLLFIDEFNSDLHPLLCIQFIKIFLQLNKKSNHNNQLILITHETRVMQLEFLRRDEITLINRNRTNFNSEIILFEDYKERFDKKIDLAYLDGQYLGLPKIDDDIELLEEILSE